METLARVEENDEQQIKESLDATNSSSLSSPKEIADPVVYKLVRVEGDGRLVPATDDEVMEVEDLLEDDRSELPLVSDTGQSEGCILKDGLPPVKDKLGSSEGISQSENAEVKVQKLNARLEYIGVMLQKVKQEERLRLSSGSPDHSSCQMKVDGGCSDQHSQLPANDETPQTDHSLQETVPLLSPKLNDRCTTQLGSEICLKPADVSKVAGSSSDSAACSSSMPDFSKIKGEICLDNLTIKELHETFRATFGRETTVKDKLWLKRRIAMGLTNSCDVSTTTFIIKDKTLIKKKIEEETQCGMKSCKSADQIDGVSNVSCKDLPTSPTNQVGDRQVISGKRLRKPEAEHEHKCEDPHTEHIGSKRVRKPTKRYIEELSEVDTQECSVKLVSTVKYSGHGQPDPKPRVRPVRNVGLDGTAVVTRQESLGGSGVQVPYVSRVRRGRPRENFMPLMKYHPSSMGMAAKLVKKALGVRVSRPDSDNGDRNVKARLPSQRIEQPVKKEEKVEKPNDVVTCMSGQQQPVEMENVDLSGDNSDCNVTTVSTAKGGARRKHHRAWTLSEVVKLVEGVSRYGAGRWSEIKRLAFASYTYRTSVDLKDKWRNLLRASFAQSPTDKGMKNSRKHAAMPIPVPILLRVRELAEKHSQAAHVICAGNSGGCSGRSSVHETRCSKFHFGVALRLWGADAENSGWLDTQ
ncbi:SANT/Myb domain [Macleaya cordata]|uniref:SANT/Myb domain n=1 Tax=Macleaya cordata TaxID=56857 RepID=A0A200QD21_MACCD|nr:SANT/Myb domain [Macleaya cordata]